MSMSVPSFPPLRGLSSRFRMFGHRPMLVGLALLLVADSAAYTGGSPRLPLASRARPALAVLGQDAADEVLSRRLAEESTGTLLGATALVAGAHRCPRRGGRVSRSAGLSRE